MNDKLEHCAAQVELRQRRAKSEVEHVKRRLEKNEVRRMLFVSYIPLLMFFLCGGRLLQPH